MEDRYILGMIVGIAVGIVICVYANYLQKQRTEQKQQLEELFSYEKSWEITYATKSGPVTCRVNGWKKGQNDYAILTCNYEQKDTLYMIHFDSIKEL